VAGSGQRGGVPLEGGSGGVAAASGEVGRCVEGHEERDPAGSGRVPGREVRGVHGLTGEGNGVGRARRKREVGQVWMNSDDF
jgi:hypothetical protein